MSEELKACPSPFPPDFGGDHELKVLGTEGKGHGFVSCSCGLKGPLRSNKAEAIAAWNTRAPDPGIAQLEAEVAGLREAVLGVVAATRAYLPPDDLYSDPPVKGTAATPRLAPVTGGGG